MQRAYMRYVDKSTGEYAQFEYWLMTLFVFFKDFRNGENRSAFPLLGCSNMFPLTNRLASDVS
jgi:hypothetical protein